MTHTFHDRLQTPQNGTEVERMVRQRVGQDIFRASLLDYWGGRCALSGLDEPQLLRASHIKGWAQCDSDQERLDVFNGLLLAAHYDALFDSGWITFLDSGEIQISPHLKPQNRKILGLTGAEVLRGLTAFHAPYLQWHRTHWFRGA
ncbi:HNH endonuclease [Paracandidimonas soli]|uniref:HNH endonuclease n=1 Tax=Paracandidimonas soli TaxID=1917182 RepID=UPI0033413864